MADVRALTGRKPSFTTIPYKNMFAFSVETVAMIDVDSELEIHLSTTRMVSFEFTGATDIAEISH